MVNLDSLISPLKSEQLSEFDRNYLRDVFYRFNGYPSLQQLWSLMDEQWNLYDCDPLVFDHRISSFYCHPVWLLNGLFIERDIQSLYNRNVFKDWVVQQRPVRVADLGGGFGGLARLIAAELPDLIVEILEPHPHNCAIDLLHDFPNVRFVSELTGDYDLLIVTDVLEHVPDPISFISGTVAFLRKRGQYLMANCFYPVIACHLPQHMHFSIAWDEMMRAMGLTPLNNVLYGRVFRPTGIVNEPLARRMGVLARIIYLSLFILPRGRHLVGSFIFRYLSILFVH